MGDDEEIRGDGTVFSMRLAHCGENLKIVANSLSSERTMTPPSSDNERAVSAAWSIRIHRRGLPLANMPAEGRIDVDKISSW